MGSVRYSVLGPLVVRRAGVSLSVGSEVERRVLGALLTAPNEPVAAADLLAAAWPDGGPEDASEQLSEAIDVLRDLVDPHRFPGADGNLIHLSGDRYMLCADRADVDSFGFDDAVLSARAARGRGDLEAAGDELRAGLGRWRGALLEGFDGAFFAAVRERFEDVRLQAFEALYEVELERGLHHEILPDLAQQVAAHPLREGYRKTFLLALYRTDRKQDALNQYAELRKRLQRMENRSPSADVRELARRIAVDDPTLLPDPSSRSRCPAPSRSATSTTCRYPRLAVPSSSASHIPSRPFSCPRPLSTSRSRLPTRLRLSYRCLQRLLRSWWRHSRSRSTTRWLQRRCCTRLRRRGVPCPTSGAGLR